MELIIRKYFVQVSDVNDDVRRAAVTGLGFLLFRYVQTYFVDFMLRTKFN